MRYFDHGIAGAGPYRSKKKRAIREDRPFECLLPYLTNTWITTLTDWPPGPYAVSV